MIELIHYEKTDRGFIEVWQEYNMVVYEVEVGVENPVLKHWDGELKTKMKVRNHQFEIGRYFPEYKGNAYLTQKKHGIEIFIGTGPLKHKGKLL